MIRSKVVTVNEELAELQRKYQLLEGDRKTYYETSQWTIKQNRDTLSSVKRENKELRSQIQSLNVSRNGGGTRAELNRMREYAANLRKRYNFLHEILTKKQKLMERQLAEAKAVELDAELVLNDDTPTMRRIRRLEKMLQKAVIKYSEANNIRRTYEQIVKRLKEERIGFDNQLSAIARTLRAKDHDLEELLLMSHDANHAKEVAKAELERVDAQLLSDKQRREKDIAERRGQAKAKQDLNARLEAREKKRREYEEAMGRRTHDRDYRKLSHDPTEEELRRISIYEEAFRKIKEATGVTDPNEIIQKFLTQEETTSHLQQVTKEAQLKIDKLNEQHAQAKALVEEVKYSGAGLLGSRRIVDEYEAKLVEANTNLDRLQARYERVAKILINMRAGTEHLWDKLTVIKIDQVLDLPVPYSQGMPHLWPGESISDFAAGVLTFSKLVAKEEPRQAEAAAELQRQQQEAAEAQGRQQEEAANAVHRLRQGASASLQRQEMEYAAKLRSWHFTPTDGHCQPSEDEKTKEDMSKLIAKLMLTCNWQQEELKRLEGVINETRDTQSHTNCSFNARLDHLEQDDAASASAGSSNSQPSMQELEERIDHVVTTIGDLATFARPVTISQQLPVLKADVCTLQQHPPGGSNPRPYKMPNLDIEKFDDYHKQDPLTWWQGFTTAIDIHLVPDHLRIAALYLNMTGACQIWLNHLATHEEVTMANLHTKISWDDLAAKWKKRFIVDNAKAHTVNQIFCMFQGTQPSPGWLTEWQKIVATPSLNIPFEHVKREFFLRSVDSLSAAVGDDDRYEDFDSIINRARSVIQTNRRAANER
ncbi:hypothetical protein CBR_g17026 [Chara braunii]|uniref:ODAD1 central coiled coil region domain-containing protein n=1 Tax=Chara braunii TaxID=69332 RepID=A0A388KUE2_CHABU|nr:hypothetical protein CBR_g17026 [Chara braunii]|eukprot:GBG73684.1 hypothetical protein CBR_g17026 [Chara braunii]